MYLCQTVTKNSYCKKKIIPDSEEWYSYPLSWHNSLWPVPLQFTHR